MFGDATPLAAQQQTEFTFHVYVDPMRGDDRIASIENPRTAGPAVKRPLADYPDPSFPDPNSTVGNGTGVLQHAPYSFRTLRACR